MQGASGTFPGSVAGDGPGQRPSGPPQGDAAWQLLDERDEWLEFSRPAGAQGGLWESSVVFEGMHCAACAVTIEQALRATPACAKDISAASHRGRVVGERHPSFRPDAGGAAQWLPGRCRPTMPRQRAPSAETRRMCGACMVSA